MPLSDGIPSSPPGSSASLEEALAYYKAQYELLESELAEFQTSSKDLEAELEKDIEASEKRERQLKEKAANLAYEADEWKAKYKQAKSEANSAQNALQREITTLRDTNRTLQLRLRDTEVANDDYERQQRNTESSLEDMESKYNQTIEREVMLEEEMKIGEQEREALRIEAQRLRDEFSDLKIEADITKEKLRSAEEALQRMRRPAPIDSAAISPSPRSEMSPSTTTSSPSFDTPPAKTTSSSGFSDAPTPPSPPTSDKSMNAPKRPVTPGLNKTRLSTVSNNMTPRPSTYTARPSRQSQVPPMPAINGRSTPSTSIRKSMSKPGTVPQRQPGLPHSNSIYQLRNLRGKMQKLEERVHTAKSKLPAPTNVSPQSSPRSRSALGHHVPTSVTLRSGRKRLGGSTINGPASLPEPPTQSTPPTVKYKSSRPSTSLAPPKPTRTEMAAPPPRPASRASASTHSSLNPYTPGQSRPGSRASISNHRTPLGGGASHNFAPNASTSGIRPTSSLSNRGFDGPADEDDIENKGVKDIATPTSRRTTIGRRTSEIGSAIPSPKKRLSFGTSTSTAASGTSRRTSGFAKRLDGKGEMKTVASREGKRVLSDVGETYDVTETF